MRLGNDTFCYVRIFKKNKTTHTLRGSCYVNDQHYEHTYNVEIYSLLQAQVLSYRLHPPVHHLIKWIVKKALLLQLSAGQPWSSGSAQNSVKGWVIDTAVGQVLSKFSRIVQKKA